MTLISLSTSSILVPDSFFKNHSHKIQEEHIDQCDFRGAIATNSLNIKCRRYFFHRYTSIPPSIKTNTSPQRQLRGKRTCSNCVDKKIMKNNQQQLYISHQLQFEESSSCSRYTILTLLNA